MKKLLAVLGIGSLVLICAMLAAAWYYSGLVIDGSKIKGATVDFSNEITAVAPDEQGGTITYTVKDTVVDPATDDYTVSRTGMELPDGSYLQLGQGATVDGRSITRPYTLLSGQQPSPGDFGQYDWDSYPDASALGLSSRAVSYQAPDGATPAIIVDPEGAPSGTWAIVVHGRNASVREGLRAVPLYAERGMTTMLLNYRDDQKEPGAPYEDGIGNFGYTEWPDLEAAVDYAVAHGAQDVVLVGWSMGGAIVPAYLEHGDNTDVVVATMMHSPVVSLHEVVVHGAAELGLPTGPLAPVIWLAERLTELRVDLDFSAAEFRDNAAAWPVPGLATGAAHDDLVPAASVEEFAEALPDGRYEYFQDASHTGEWNSDSQRFDELVGGWLDENVVPLG